MKNHEKHKKGTIILWIILIGSVLALLICGGAIYWEAVIIPAQAENTADEIRAIATGQIKSDSSPKSETENQQKPLISQHCAK